jgi:hypothetical protein
LQLVSASEDGSVALFDRRNRKVLRRLHFTKGTFPLSTKTVGSTLYVGDKVCCYCFFVVVAAAAAAAVAVVNCCCCFCVVAAAAASASVVFGVSVFGCQDDYNSFCIVVAVIVRWYFCF